MTAIVYFAVKTDSAPDDVSFLLNFVRDAYLVLSPEHHVDALVLIPKQLLAELLELSEAHYGFGSTTL
jgi:hypothetical protein